MKYEAAGIVIDVRGGLLVVTSGAGTKLVRADRVSFVDAVGLSECEGRPSVRLWFEGDSHVIVTGDAPFVEVDGHGGRQPWEDQFEFELRKREIRARTCQVLDDAVIEARQAIFNAFMRAMLEALNFKRG